MNGKKLSVLVATGLFCLVGSMLTLAAGNNSAQPNQSTPKEERVSTNAEDLEALLKEKPTAAGQPQEEALPTNIRKWHTPDGMRTGKGLTQEND